MKMIQNNEIKCCYCKKSINFNLSYKKRQDKNYLCSDCMYLEIEMKQKLGL